MPNQKPLPPPANIAEVDSRLRKLFLKYGAIITLLLLGFPIALIPLQTTMAHLLPVAFGWSHSASATPMALYPQHTGSDLNRVFTSPASVVLDALSAAVVMTAFWFGIGTINRSLIQYAREFAERADWASVANVLESFNQSGQHFLDGTGEAHYWLSKALARIGKPEKAAKAREFVLQRKSASEWAAKLQADGIANEPPSPSKRPAEKKAGRAKRRRF
ncbi:MAG: hypothetical protein P4L33_22840 [Capsulimonadaceae bacterium]|nr:hypothetical protein [Capsulimonadaceae bacterium]